MTSLERVDTKPRKRVLFVSNFYPPRAVGGAEVVAHRQAKALHSRGYQVTVLAGDLPGENNPAGSFRLEEHEGLPVYRLTLQSLEPDENFFWPLAANRLRTIIASHEIDAVHFHNVMGLGANLIPAAKEAGALCVVTLHDHWGFCYRQTRLRANGSLCRQFDECAQCMSAIQPRGRTALPMRLRRDYVFWCLKQADILLTPSKYLAGAYAEAGFPAERIRAVSNGIDIAAITEKVTQSRESGKVSFLCSSYLGEHKGIPVLLKALEILARDQNLRTRWQMTIAGDGHLKASVEQAANSDLLSPYVHFPGRIPREELLQRMSESHVVVLPSIWPENEPVTMLEAVALGAAQVATRTGGNLELVEEGLSGMLVKPGDPDELANALRSYIVNTSLAAAHGEYNRRRRKQFDEAITIDKLEDVLAGTPAATSNEVKDVIICGAGWPALEVGALTGSIHQHLGQVVAPRFIWREWADPAVWRDAALLWMWDRHPEEPLVNAALRRGIPVVAPANGWSEGLARHYGGVVLYHTYLEALAIIRALLALPALRAEIARRSREASTAAAALAPSAAYSLVTEREP